ncbi:biopolymer transporter Tol [Occultella glacieicola]|uniref:Biopolymer transporter Tol n=1 Tax=Occultella glacieicola TaxID=2518684 RepID=A0ABY2E0M2_9MICO|nr:PD40 domain-containing protein [Occultella glacieicola]TDE90059.1 biopolymer transporter Tol [Occultella glacieicola]
MRVLRPGQRAELFIVDVETGERRLVYESSALLFEAPNWTPDGKHLLVNAEGLLYRLPIDGGHLAEIPLGGIPPINNDHVLSPDGETVYVSADDGHLYAIPFATGLPRRVSNDHGDDFRHFLHGVSPDGETLAYIGLRTEAGGAVTTNVFTLPVSGGEDTQLTDDPFPNDGSEYSTDGRLIYFNSERASANPGHAQLFRMSTDGSSVEQLTHDERVNWFPHVSPDGERIVYVSFPPGTIGHPADHDVIIRLIEPDGAVRDLVSLFGGQGTMNVPSWSPDSRQVAYAAYPLRS